MAEDKSWDAVWRSLVQTGIDGGEDGQGTLTPSAYVADELSLPLPESQVFHPEVVVLPELHMDPEGREGHADLQVQSALGKGGMGEVLLAHQRSLEREVAVKRLHHPDPRHIQALLREARIMGGLAHPNIVPVHALGRDEDGNPLLVMKRVEGERWAASLAGPDDPTRLGSVVLDAHLQILKDLCNAVDYAHSKGVIHRDIKPDNVLIGAFGEVMLADWGVAARLGEPDPEVALGTPSYMAPEMVHGEAPTVQTDVYLLGATLHRVLIGRPRHVAASVEAAFMSAWRSRRYEYPPEVPHELAQIANKAMSRRAEDRYSSAGALRDALEAFETHRSSRHLASTAAARMGALRAAIDRPSADPIQTAEIGAACRFGFRQALDAWPENDGAKSNLRRCLELMVPWTLEHGTPQEAEALLAELEALVDNPSRYEAQRDEVQTALRRAKALEKLGRELDWSVASGWRLGFLLFYSVAAFVGGSITVLLVRTGLVPLGHEIGLVGGLLAAFVLTVLILVGRKTLMPNLASQRVIYTVLAAAWSIVFHRVLAWSVSADLHYTIVQDVVILMVCSAVAAVGVHLRLFFLTFALACTALAAAALPGWSFEIATGSLALSGVLLTAVFAPWSRR